MSDRERLSFPAYEQIGRDVQLGYARWRVYMHLVNDGVLSLHRPTEVKVSGVCASLKMSRRKVTDALDWLTERGYLMEHTRQSRRVRVLTLEWAVAPKRAA